MIVSILGFLRKSRLHILIWAVMLLYVAAAPSFYSRFLLSSGKPVSFSEKLPSRTKQINYSVDRLDPIGSAGQNLYDLWGWTFFRKDTDQSAYNVYIVLKSDRQTYFFLTTPFSRPRLNKVFPKAGIDLSNSGFRTSISRDAIAVGSYRIGILFKHKSTGAMYFTWSNKSVERTPNHLQLFNY